MKEAASPPEQKCASFWNTLERSLWNWLKWQEKNRRWRQEMLSRVESKNISVVGLTLTWVKATRIKPPSFLPLTFCHKDIYRKEQNTWRGTWVNCWQRVGRASGRVLPLWSFIASHLWFPSWACLVFKPLHHAKQYVSPLKKDASICIWSFRLQWSLFLSSFWTKIRSYLKGNIFLVLQLKRKKTLGHFSLVPEWSRPLQLKNRNFKCNNWVQNLL